MAQTSVLIVGGGPVGMALGLELGRLGVDSTVVERNEGVTTHPKSRGCTTRTMEDFRIWGIEDAIRAGGMGDGPDVAWVCRSITGPVIGTTQASPGNIHSPSAKSLVAQDVVERELAGALHRCERCDLRRRTELVRFEVRDDGVTGWVRDLGTGEEDAIDAAYLIACDGAGSTVRRELGIEMVGPPLLATMANYYYRADTSQVPQATLGNVIFNVYPEDPSVPVGRIAPSGPDNERWIFIDALPEGGEPYDEEALTSIVRTHWGIPDLEVELLSTLAWRMSAQVPETFRRGRALLAGDAAHRFPPAGGMGLNSGIQDARNLGWKLAMVLLHGASDRLLDTYEMERRPVAESNNQWSMGNAGRLARVDGVLRDPEAPTDELRSVLLELSNHLNSEGQGFGIPYETGALIPDGRPAGSHDPRVHWPSDRPGERFPHLWLDAAHTTSTIDWFTTEFVLVCGPTADRWRDAGTAVRADGARPLRVETLPNLGGTFTVAADGAVLVRPDGIVAWCPQVTDDHARHLERALDEILAGGPQAGERP